jgi:transcriptional regulator with XRE-family HTH domain
MSAPRRYRFVGAKLRQFREARGESREQFAARQHPPCSVSKIVKAELGYHVPRIETLAGYAASLSVRLEDLLALDEPEVAAR